MYICEYSFNKEDPNIPGSSMDEVDYYAWIPAKFHKQIPNHRLSLLKNLISSEYEFHRVYMNTVIGRLSYLGIVVTQREKGYTEVAYKTESLEDAVAWGNREYDRFHYVPGEDHHDDKVCQHVHPYKSNFCEGPKPVEVEG